MAPHIGYVSMSVYSVSHMQHYQPLETKCLLDFMPFQSAPPAFESLSSKARVVLRVTCLASGHTASEAGLLKHRFCNNLMFLRVTCFKSASARTA
jgi:hypothetical protein